MIVRLLLSAGSVIIGTLGLIHLVYTLRTNKFEPRDEQLGEQLRQVAPVLTSETTMWKAWVGFNASHSLGALLFAAFYGYLALFELEFLLSSVFLVAVSLAALGSYLVLARAYWFRVPFFGIALSTALFVAGYSFAFAEGDVRRDLPEGIYSACGDAFSGVEFHVHSGDRAELLQYGEDGSWTAVSSGQYEETQGRLIATFAPVRATNHQDSFGDEAYTLAWRIHQERGATVLVPDSSSPGSHPVGDWAEQTYVHEDRLCQR